MGVRLFLVLVVFAAAPTILVVSVSDFALQSTINEEIGKAALGKLRVARGIETILGDLARNTSMRMAIDPELQALGRFSSYREILSEGGSQYLFARYLERLDDTVRTNPLFYSIDILFDGTDYVMSTEYGTSRREDYVDSRWLETTRRDHEGTGAGIFLPPHRIGGKSSDPLVLSYYFPFSSYLSEAKGAVFIHLNEREFSRLINDTQKGAQGLVALVDAQGTVVSHPDVTRIGTPWDSGSNIPLLDPQQTEGVVTDTRDGGQLVTWYRPDQGSWTYVGSFSLGALTRNVGQTRVLTVGASLAVILLGIGVAYLIAQRFFHPVRRLIREVSRRIGRQEDWEDNELTLLSGAFDILLKRETQLFQDLESQAGLRHEDWARKALRGDLPTGPESLPPGTGGQFWLAGVVVIDRYSRFASSFPSDQREYLRSVVLHMMEQAFLPQVRCLGTMVDSRMIGLVLWTDETDGGRFADRIDDGFELVASEVTRVLGTSVTLCLGTRGQGPDHLTSSWNEGVALVHQRFLQGPGHWFWEENPAVTNTTPFFPLRAERALVAALGKGDSAALAEALSDLRSEITGRRDLSYDNVHLILHQVVGGLVRHLVEDRVDLTRFFGSGGDLHQRLSEFETFVEAFDWLSDTLQEVLQRRREGGEEGHVPAMVRYIRANVHRDFGVEAVAESVGLSYSHARRVFEEAMGETIVDYINSLRVEEARALLTGSPQTLEAVAETVGYNNVQSFHRHFKKATGITPGEFRARSQGVE